MTGSVSFKTKANTAGRIKMVVHTLHSDSICIFLRRLTYFFKRKTTDSMHQIRLFLCTGSADHVGNGRMICARVDVNGFCKGDLGDPLVLKALGTVYSSIACIYI